jgi:hypothetical protein
MKEMLPSDCVIRTFFAEEEESNAYLYVLENCHLPQPEGLANIFHQAEVPLTCWYFWVAGTDCPVSE